MNEQQQAVVQQALEALKGLYAITEIAQEDIDCRFAWAEMPDAKEAITALRQLLEQPVQEPVALIQERDELQKQLWLYEKHGVTCQTYGNKVESTCSECNVQENYTSHNNTGGLCPATKPNGVCGCYEKGFTDGINEFLLYETTPPAQLAAWVGLTYEEAKEIYTCIHGHDSEIRLCKAIEAKLKEKNT